MSGFFDAPDSPPPQRFASPFGKVVGGIVLVVVGVLLLAVLINIWPVVARTGPKADTAKAVEWISPFDAHWSKSTGLVVLAMVMGAIGGYLHTATSFAGHIARRDFYASWGWWYALRLLVGGSLALVVYFTVRAGFLSAVGGTQATDAYGVAAICGIAGLFTEQFIAMLSKLVTRMQTSQQGGAAAKGAGQKAEPRNGEATGAQPGRSQHAAPGGETAPSQQVASREQAVPGGQEGHGERAEPRVDATGMVYPPPAPGEQARGDLSGEESE